MVKECFTNNFLHMAHYSLESMGSVMLEHKILVRFIRARILYIKLIQIDGLLIY